MNKTILVLGGDGYYGWPLAIKIAILYPNHKIVIVDNEWRRNIVKSYGFQTLIPLASPARRIAAFRETHNQNNLHYLHMDVNSDQLDDLIAMEKPHTIFHMAQQCSAPYSMKGLAEALYTIHNNEEGNMRLLWSVRKHIPQAHIIKLGSFGEYAQGGIDIAEGYFFPRHKGIEATKRMPYPREADDIYHVSKINDSNYVATGCRVWKLRITDVMQSTIFGFLTDEMKGNEDLYTRCDYDHMFGTVVNRFLTQVVAGHPLTVYGKGNQRTGLMALKDSVNSLVSFVENIPEAGTHKVVNHVTETNFSINELASSIKVIAEEKGYEVSVIRTHDPRDEQVDIKPVYGIETALNGHDKLHTSFAEVTKEMLGIIERFKSNISKTLFVPKVSWSEDLTMAKPTHTFSATPTYKDDNYWEFYRVKNFQSDRINLNPGTLGTTSAPVKKVRYNQYSSTNMEGFPLGSYEAGRKKHGEIAILCDQIWPSTGYHLSVTHSTSQTMNLLALSLLRKFQHGSKKTYTVITTGHEHDGGIGCFENLPEYVVEYIDDKTLSNKHALAKRIKMLQPDLALFSQVYYDTGAVTAVADWMECVKDNAPGCKIILDAAQSIGLYNLPFGTADVVVASTHKWLFGPHGGGLMWIRSEFQNWIGAMYWSDHGLGYLEDVNSISIPGGQDFHMYEAIRECLTLFKNTGQETILARSSYLRASFQEQLSEVLFKYDIRHSFLNTQMRSPLVSVAFEDYDPYQVYQFLNGQRIHTKCIKNHKIGHEILNILRIGIPYYETTERLRYVVSQIDQYLQKEFCKPVRVNKPTLAEIFEIAKPGKTAPVLNGIRK